MPGSVDGLSQNGDTSSLFNSGGRATARLVAIRITTVRVLRQTVDLSCISGVSGDVHKSADTGIFKIWDDSGVRTSGAEKNSGKWQHVTSGVWCWGATH